MSAPRIPLSSAAIVAVSLLATACGASRAPTILNTEKIERVIEHSALVQRGVHAAVSCPSGVLQRKGWVFSCTASVGHTVTQFVVTELDAAGNVHYAAR